MNTPLEKQIARELDIFDEESSKQMRLTAEERQFFIDTWTDVVRTAASKFVAGKRKYLGTDFFDDCDHMKEIKYELVDGIHYSYGARHKMIRTMQP